MAILIRIATVAATVLWTVAVLALYEALQLTGTTLAALQDWRFDPEIARLTERVLHLVDMAGLFGVIALWILGMIAILLVRAILRAIFVGRRDRAGERRSVPASRPPPMVLGTPATAAPSPATPAAPRPGPWGGAETAP